MIKMIHTVIKKSADLKIGSKVLKKFESDFRSLVINTIGNNETLPTIDYVKGYLSAGVQTSKDEELEIKLILHNADNNTWIDSVHTKIPGWKYTEAAN